MRAQELFVLMMSTRINILRYAACCERNKYRQRNYLCDFLLLTTSFFYLAIPFIPAKYPSDALCFHYSWSFFCLNVRLWLFSFITLDQNAYSLTMMIPLPGSESSC